MGAWFCNPINISYHYQFIPQPNGDLVAAREGADPSLVRFKGRYFLFPSMNCGFFWTDDLAHWAFHATSTLPVYDYAPDVRVRGDWLYFCASNHDHGTFYRTKDPFSDEWETIEGEFPFWDPNEFFDEDGRMYLYWGSHTIDPVYAVEIDPETGRSIGEHVELVRADLSVKGFERNGENHVRFRSDEEIQAILDHGMDSVPEQMKAFAISYISEAPYIEGPWMNRHQDTYYLQVAETSSGRNIYSDVVYTSKSPLGPFVLAKNAPMSYKPGGFIPGAGHGSTAEDEAGGAWHVATQRIVINQHFERRIGLWPCGWDADGEMFCNQRYGDWPVSVDEASRDPWANPAWMLLSAGAEASASSCAAPVEQDDPDRSQNRILRRYDADCATDENIRTWWKAATPDPGEWLCLDLRDVCDVHAVQVNFADDHLMPGLPDGAEMHGTLNEQRWIDEQPQYTRWLLEGSKDGLEWFVIEDKRTAETDLPHDLIVREDGVACRFLRLCVTELPYGQEACVSGLRVFGKAPVEAPIPASDVSAVRDGDLDLDVSWQGSGCGYAVEWGYAPDKLYHSFQVLHQGKPGDRQHLRISALVKDEPVFVRVDSWNGGGITEGAEIV